MSRKWIGGLVAVAAIGATALAASSVLGAGGGADPRPAYATVHVDLSKQAPATARPSADAKGKKKPKKPKVVYLQSPSPQPINPADAPAGSGPVHRREAHRLLEGDRRWRGAEPHGRLRPGDLREERQRVPRADRTRRREHPANRAPFTITSNLTCLKGTK